MAHTKAGGSTRLGRDSQGQRLGVKLYAGEKAIIGNILVRQRGSKIRPGLNVRMGKDNTLYAVADGIVKFSQKTIVTFAGAKKVAKFVNITQKT